MTSHEDRLTAIEDRLARVEGKVDDLGQDIKVEFDKMRATTVQLWNGLIEKRLDNVNLYGEMVRQLDTMSKALQAALAGVPGALPPSSPSAPK